MSVGAAQAEPPEEQLLFEAVDHLPIAVVLLAAGGVIFHANDAFGHLVGRTPSELCGIRLGDIVTNDAGEVDEMLRRWSASTGMRPGVLQVETDDEADGVLDLRCDGARLRAHPLTLVIAREREQVTRPFAELSREIEAQNLREMRSRLEESVEELRVTNRRLVRSNEELEAYAQVVSHDLRSPLATIIGFTELLADRTRDPDDESGRMLEIIRQAARRMDEVTDGLLRLSRISGGDPNPVRVDPNEVLAEVTDQLGSELHEAGGTVDSGGLHHVTAEPAHVVQVLQNLVANSIKFRQPDRPLHIDVTSQRDGGWVRIAVRDNGVGVPDEEREDIFEVLGRGTTTKDVPGSGIGLSTCRKIVELYGGRIDCLPAGQGAHFAFTLPAG